MLANLKLLLDYLTLASPLFDYLLQKFTHDVVFVSAELDL
jgi:hypothetical protein